MRRRVWRRALPALLLPLAAAATPAQARAEEGDRPARLVIVTVERRVGAFFASRPAEYGDSLQAWRHAVVELVFGSSAPLARPGDVIALFADGAPQDFPRRTVLDRDAGTREVMRALGPMLAFPGAPPGEPVPQVWLHAVDGSSRVSLDQAIRSRITCALVARHPGCIGEGGGLPSQESRAFSRPLLTLPIQYEAAQRALVELKRSVPGEVFWVWVQVGERINETNSLAAEIVRDFRPSTAVEAVARFREHTTRLLDIRPEPRGDVGVPGRGGGVTLWQVRSNQLHALTQPTTTFPLRFQGRHAAGAWTLLEPQADVASTLYGRADRLLEAGALRLHLLPPAGPGIARISDATGEARCAGGGAPLPLRFEVAPDGQSATLVGEDGEFLEALAAACVPGEGIWERIAREVRGGGERARLRVIARARVGVPERPDAPPVPPLLASATLERTWRHAHLGGAARALHVLGLVALVVLSVLAYRYLRYRRSPVRLGIELLGPDGRPASESPPLVLHPESPAAEPCWLALQPVCGGGPPSNGRVRLRVSGRGLQSDVPLVPGCEPGAVLGLRTRPATASSASAEGLVYDGLLAPGPAGSGIPAGWIAPVVNASAVDLDRMSVEHPVHAGMELTVHAVPETPGIEARTLVFYVPCTITVRRTAARAPEMRVELLQRYLYRGLRPSAIARGEVVVGMLRVHHRAEPHSLERPNPVSLALRVSARVEQGGQPPVPLRAGLRRDGTAPGEEIHLDRLDKSRTDVPIHLWTEGLSQLVDGPAAVVRIEVAGSWREERDDGRGASGPLSPVHATVSWYPVASLYGVAIDFGTSATRMALLSENSHEDDVVNFQLPEKMVSFGDDPVRTLEKGIGRSGEIESEVVIDRDGNLVAAGYHAFLEKRSQDDRVLTSLKSELMEDADDERVWTAARQLVSILAEVVESPRRGEREAALCRWGEGVWNVQDVTLPRGFRYLLLVTVPDTFSAEDQVQFMTLFEPWRGRVDLVPLREAEAVVYGALRDAERRPERTLVVDVGAGTVDYAAVRTVFARSGLTEIRVEGLAVSREAGNAFDVAVRDALNEDTTDPRTLRDIKQRRFCDPEITGADSAEIKKFLASAEAEKYFDGAITQPLQALRGRLAAQESWIGQGFDQVVLTGRGSLGAGWKRRLVSALVDARLVPSSDESGWLRWTTTGSLARRADRLKGAVVEGALALIRYDQARIQTSRDILRDHVLLLGQDSQRRFHCIPLWDAGDLVPAEGLSRTIPVGDWIDARLVLSSHSVGPEVEGPARERMRVTEQLLWDQSLRGSDGWRGVEVRLVSGIDMGAPPPGSGGIQVRAGPGGVVRWRWSDPT